MSKAQSFPYSSFVALGAQALLPIALGSFKSLRTPAAVRARRRKARKARRDKLVFDDESDADDDDESEFDETLTLMDSLLFPILGSCALIGLWYLIKYVDKKWIDLMLGVYFSGAGIFAVHTTFSSIINGGLRLIGRESPVYHVRISAGIKQVFHLPMRIGSAISLIPATVLPIAYVPLGRPWFLTNVLALCLGTGALALLRLDGFPTAFLLLALLLVYDIFWVFYTPVMVTVAKGIDAPIKLLAPKAGSVDFAMLGLGDVVIPGLVIALCLRFDLARHAANHPTRDVTARSKFGKPYFWTAIVSYIAGLVATIIAMQTQERAQPALLYLSPACTFGPLLLAFARGELGLLWKWREETNDDDEEKRDDTIEAPSEVAQKARAATRAAAAEVQAQAEDVLAAAADAAVPEAAVPEDDSWMNDGAVGASETKARKRKGGKRK